MIGVARMCSRQERHRLELLRTGRLVHDHLQPRHLAVDERARQQLQPRGVDGGLEHRMARAIEADELATHAAVHDSRLDAGAGRRAVDGLHFELAPRAAVGEHDAANDRGGDRLVLRIRDRGARKDAHVVGEVHDGRARRDDVAIGRRLEERLQDDRLVAPFDAHRRAVHGAVGGDGRDDAFRRSRHLTRSTGGGTNAPSPSSSRRAHGSVVSGPLCTLSPPSAPVGSSVGARARAVQETIEHRVSVLGRGRLGVKLHADHRMFAVLDGHDLAVVARRRDDPQRGRQRGSRDDERVIAGDSKR